MRLVDSVHPESQYTARKTWDRCGRIHACICHVKGCRAPFVRPAGPV